MVTQPDVTFTDYGLAMECALLVYYLRGRSNPDQPLLAWFLMFFGSLGLAALAGGTVHGFFLNPETIGRRILWPTTLISIGMTALSAWAIGARLLLSEKAARWIVRIAVFEFAIYGLIVLFFKQNFRLAIMNYLPAALFLFVAFLVIYTRTGERPALTGLAGLVLTFIAAGVQQGRIGLHPVYFDHNAFYHLIQAVALFMIFWEARWLITIKTSHVRRT